MTIHTFYQLNSKVTSYDKLSYKSISVNASNDFCVHLNTARYVLGCSKYFEQLKTPCPYRKLDFLRSRKSFQISDAIFTLLNGLNYPLPTLLLIL